MLVVKTFFGIPAHPLLVHLPVAFLPLAFVGVVVMLLRPTWWERYKWATLLVTGVGAIGAVIAANAGEELERSVDGRGSALLENHTQAGDTAKVIALLFFVVVAAAVLIPVLLRRRGDKSMPSWWRPIVSVALVASGVASMVTIYDAGHSGAKATWHDVNLDGGQRGGQGDGDGG